MIPAIFLLDQSQAIEPHSHVRLLTDRQGEVVATLKAEALDMPPIETSPERPHIKNRLRFVSLRATRDEAFT